MAELTHSIAEARDTLRDAIASDVPINLIGPPGIGKSAIVAAVAREIPMDLETMILSLCDPTDIGGFPVADGKGGLDRLPLGSIRRACDVPTMLFLDELSCAPPAVQGAALRLVYERVAGDRKLHSDTRVICAMNPPAQAAGGWDLALPMVGRLTSVYLVPTLDEIRGYFYSLGAPGSPLRDASVDFAATLEHSTDLVQIDPPAGSQASGKAWGAPRSWERAVRLLSVMTSNGQGDSPRALAALAGAIGQDCAAAYMTIRKVRARLPTIGDIVRDPSGAKLPDDIDTGVASLGVLAQVCQRDPSAGWVYVARLPDAMAEVQVAMYRIVMRHPVNAKSPHGTSANRDRVRLMGRMGKISAGL